jgi:hypothetical protein
MRSAMRGPRLRASMRASGGARSRRLVAAPELREPVPTRCIPAALEMTGPWVRGRGARRRQSGVVVDGAGGRPMLRPAYAGRGLSRGAWRDATRGPARGQSGPTDCGWTVGRGGAWSAWGSPCLRAAALEMNGPGCAAGDARRGGGRARPWVHRPGFKGPAAGWGPGERQCTSD